MKIAVVADTQLLSHFRTSRAMFPRKMQMLGERTAAVVYRQIVMAIEAATNVVIEWLQATGPWDLIVHVGDVTSGWKERGIVHHSVIEIAERLMQQFRLLTPRLVVVPGDHDVGYGTLGGGINVEALTACKKIFGPLCRVEVLEEQNLLLIAVCSSLAQYQGNNTEILNIKHAQEELITRTLRAYPKFGWFLCAYHPDTPRWLAPVILPHLSRLRCFTFSHLHMPGAGALERSKAILNPARLWSPEAQVLGVAHQRSIFCPSVAPVWSAGHRLLTLTIPDHKQGQDWILPNHISLEPTSWTRGLPITNPLWCAWWTMQAHRPALTP